MKYYLYISDAKIDMLFPQVPHQIKKKTASEFKLDLKLFSASRKSETETEVSNIARLEAVVEFIRGFGNLGTLTNRMNMLPTHCRCGGATTRGFLRKARSYILAAKQRKL